MVFGRNPLFLIIVFISGWAQAQNPEFWDTIHSSQTCAKEDYRFDLAMGQFFISGASAETGVSRLKCFGNPALFPVKHAGLAGAVRIVTFGPSQQSNYSSSSSTLATSGHTTYRLSAAGDEIDPDKTLWEFFPDPKQAFNLYLHNGMGNSRVDLSGMSVSGVDITSGLSDVILTWSRPNQVDMGQLKITGGMGQITIRNIELSRAKLVQINNGLGNTKITISSGQLSPQVINLEVGAGTCTLVTDSDVPMKLVIMKNMLSTIEIPESFASQAENEYVNASYRKNPSKPVIVNVDVGLGSFILMPSGN